jgi:hypothetical protein
VGKTLNTKHISGRDGGEQKSSRLLPFGPWASSTKIREKEKSLLESLFSATCEKAFRTRKRAKSLLFRNLRGKEDRFSVSIVGRFQRGKIGKNGRATEADAGNDGERMKTIIANQEGFSADLGNGEVPLLFAHDMRPIGLAKLRDTNRAGWPSMASSCSMF